MRPVLVRIQPPQPSFPIANDQVVALRSSVYPWCTSHLTVVSPNSAKADARREGRKLPTIMLLTCPITALSLTTPTVSRDFMSYFFCPRTHLPHGTRTSVEAHSICSSILDSAQSGKWIEHSQHNPNSCLLAPKRLSTPDKFYKRSQGENTSPSAGFFLAVQPTPWSRIVVAFRSVISGRCFIRAARLVFLASGFHRLGATKPVRSETTSSTVVRCQPWFYRGLMAQSFFGLSEGD